MANIKINEVSQNYTYNIGTSSYATVALPITASWGPGYVEPATIGASTRDEVLETTVWQRFPATQAGLEAFVAAYRGPAANYRIAKDYSYQMAMTLLTAGYDVLVCRLCPGTKAEATFNAGTTEEKMDEATGEKIDVFTKGNATFTVKAKYPGTFGNKLMVTLSKVPNKKYFNLVTYVLDDSGTRTAVENLLFVFDIEDSTDTILHIDELESDFLSFVVSGTIKEDNTFAQAYVELANGSDKMAIAENATAATILPTAREYARDRYSVVNDTPDMCDYIRAYDALIDNLAKVPVDITKAAVLEYKEWLYTNVIHVYDLLKDKLSYSPQRIISPGWDDQNFTDLTGEPYLLKITQVSPLHVKLLDLGYYSRCGTALLDVPKCLSRSFVYNESTKANETGYAQLLARYTPANASYDVNSALYCSNGALQAPWGSYTYVGTSKKNPASPSFLMLMIQRAMILNQASQYEWALPTNRKHNLDIGKLDYTVSKKQLDEWQKLEGVGVNIITTIPDLGTTLWGNSTLFEVPPATYQALANLSTRYLVNAIKDLVYRVGIQITFQYNNEQAYSSFYAGVTPLLDTMKNLGAIDDYLVKMAADIDGLDQVNANTVVGKIYLVVNGVVNDIIVDLIALPPGTDLSQFAE